MIKDYHTIVEEFERHLAKSGKQYYSDFYIGISNDAEHRLFTEHNVDKKYSWWIYRTAVSPEVAREIKEYYVSKGMRSSQTPENASDRMVYCYAVSPTTAEL